MHPLQLTQNHVERNLRAVRERVSQACHRAGRSESEVEIIGVTKYVDATVAGFLVQAGCHQLAESRPQSLWEKSAALANASVRWHLIGHLQRNKAKRTLPLIEMFHALDSERLFDQIALDMPSTGDALPCLIEVNISGDQNKTGMQAEEARRLLDLWRSSRTGSHRIEIVGLMGMSSLEGGGVQAHRDFEALRTMRDRMQTDCGLPLPELSMGMSDDFEIGIEHGATMVRLGSCLFSSDGTP